MARILIILAVAAVVFTVLSIVDCAVQPESRHRGVSKRTWVVITLVPVIGGILWWTIGRARPGYVAAGAASRIGPEDDPAFLSASDERIRRLEEELALLDAEAEFDDAPKLDDAPPSDAGDEDGEDGDADPQRDADGNATDPQGEAADGDSDPLRDADEDAPDDGDAGARTQGDDPEDDPRDARG
ncbi:PLD nuclease N-terminal domain-containing protein [Microbacterium karelineae]|uniref:PLD nuclease N-terminal domain-containing protein n=1 Tax=Microbacterium karelineae TaxID=2654283 RepID=UPI0012EA0D63|nr:PLD nuclease N-terminal domain-containing protein [Microbacterium karelineae]